MQPSVVQRVMRILPLWTPRKTNPDKANFRRDAYSSAECAKNPTMAEGVTGRSGNTAGRAPQAGPAWRSHLQFKKPACLANFMILMPKRLILSAFSQKNCNRGLKCLGICAIDITMMGYLVDDRTEYVNN
jgi:hypothetical protein